MKLEYRGSSVAPELFAAARVSKIMGARQVGRWRLEPFAITDREYGMRLALRKMRCSGHPERELEREIPPGEYITLQRRMTPEELRKEFYAHTGCDPEEWAEMSSMPFKTAQDALDDLIPLEKRWTPVMSDTPIEICEHAPAFQHATGRVLITGLGLGCLPHALLAKPGITWIDVIEIDPEVIELTGPTLLEAARRTDVDVAIHKTSATTPLDVLPKGTRFDYVWHDIWSAISANNLREDTAEHHISYRKLFDIYEEAFDVGRTDAWAYDEAREMEIIEAEEKAEEMEFRAYLKNQPLDEQVQILMDRIIAERMQIDHPPLGEYLDKDLRDMALAALDPDGRLEEHLRDQLSDPDMWQRFEQWVEKGREVSRPNAHLEV